MNDDSGECVSQFPYCMLLTVLYVIKNSNAYIVVVKMFGAYAVDVFPGNIVARYNKVANVRFMSSQVSLNVHDAYDRRHTIKCNKGNTFFTTFK